MRERIQKVRGWLLTLLAAWLAIAFIWIADSGFFRGSAQTVENRVPTFKFRPVHGRKHELPNLGSTPPSPGQLLGKGTIDFSSDENATAVALQGDGKIVTAGSVKLVGSSNATNWDFVVFRYNTDGSLDTSFDGDGKVTTPISDEFNSFDYARSVAIQTDGKIIAAGGSGGSLVGNFTLVRYNTNGSLDTSFGSGGKVITASTFGGINEIAIQTDGKIVAVGHGFSVVRYNTDGSLDASFGTGGIVGTSFGMQYQWVNSVALQTDGRIVAAGSAGFCDDDENCFYDFALARYNPDGSLDTSFDSDGKVTTAFGTYDIANSVVLQPDGKILTSGYAYTMGTGFAFARYNGDGSPDTTFDNDGKVTISVGNESSGYSAALQSDGKIVACGITLDSGGYGFALVRLNSNGSPDTSFDGDGTLTTDFGNTDSADDVAIQADGRIIAVGSSWTYLPSELSDFALSRYNADGSLDGGFDADGKLRASYLVVPSAVNAVTADGGTLVGYSNNGLNDDFALLRGSNKTIVPVGNSNDRANAATVDPSGRLIAAGYSDNGSNLDFALVRFNDVTFGTNGKVTTDFGGNNDEAKAIAVQADYKILVLGHSMINGTAALVLARYNQNGSLDTSFGSAGSVITQSIQNPKAMALQVDGKIIAVGNAPHTESPFGTNFAIARLNADGTLDTSFDGDGIAVTRFDFASQINSVALQPYGKIVVAGSTRNNADTLTEFAVARYNSNGSLDTSFDLDGKVTTSFGSSYSFANAVGVQRNGKIVAAGVTLSGSTARDFAVVRFNQDGSLDTTFNTNGRHTTDYFGGNDDAFAAAVQSDGNIVVAGSAHSGGKFDFAVARYVGDAVRKVGYDYDGDGSADVSVFRPSNGIWYLDRSTQGFYATQWGTSTDKITPADFDGDGRTDLAVFRDGTWYLRTSFFASPEPIQFGSAGDIPVPGDYGDTDGRAELVIYRNGEWWSRNLRNGEVTVIQFGLPADKPVPADYDGDGRVDQAVYRDGQWHINQSSNGYTVINFGLAGDRPVVADYDGDGKADPSVYRDGVWYVLGSTQGFSAFQWGLASDTPAPADYDGDGKADPAIYRNGVWYMLQTAGGVSIRQFGLGSDRPTASAYVPQ